MERFQQTKHQSPSDIDDVYIYYIYRKFSKLNLSLFTVRITVTVGKTGASLFESYSLSFFFSRLIILDIYVTCDCGHSCRICNTNVWGPLTNATMAVPAALVASVQVDIDCC